jgi:hypothetical protein
MGLVTVLLGQASQALASRQSAAVAVELPTGATAGIYCRPVRGEDRLGCVAHVKLIDTGSAQTAGAARVPAGGCGFGRAPGGASRWACPGRRSTVKSASTASPLRPADLPRAPPRGRLKLRQRQVAGAVSGRFACEQRADRKLSSRLCRAGRSLPLRGSEIPTARKKAGMGCLAWAIQRAVAASCAGRVGDADALTGIRILKIRRLD